MSPEPSVRVRAFAKINVTLRVLGVRPDGYHELRTVFQSLALHDRLRFETVRGALTIESDDPGCPTDKTNLVWRAAELVWRAAGRRGPVRDLRVTIAKGIPMQAGLGGGSSDAAAALRALSRLWCPGLSAGRLEQMGVSLGADVPFFFRGGTALGVERGDRLFQLVDAPPAWVVLARPDFGVSTGEAFGWFDQASSTGRRGNRARPAGPYGEGGNDLEKPVAARHPVIARLVSGLRRHGAFWAAMSGSGSVCFGLFSSASAARSAVEALRSSRCVTVLTRTQTARQYARQSRLMAHVRARS